MKLYLKSFFYRISIFFGFFFFSFLTQEIKIVHADIIKLTPCKESIVFQKRSANSIKKLETKLKLYVPQSKEASSIQKEINQTILRFERYQNSNLLCGKDGLPRIIATGQWDHVNEFIVPSILFLYITGWIGWAGRKYVQYAATTENPFENEIILNVPFAISIMFLGGLWPFEALKEFRAGELLSVDEDITISPR